MGFEIEKLDLEGMLLIHAHVANDNRGFYRKNFERNIWMNCREKTMEYSKFARIEGRKIFLKKLKNSVDKWDQAYYNNKVD